MGPYRSRPDPGTVSHEDLGRLAEVRALLAALENPSAALPRLALLASELPPLSYRLVARATSRAPERPPSDVAGALAIVGNRGLEAVLLELLEDLTILRAELDETVEAPASGGRWKK